MRRFCVAAVIAASITVLFTTAYAAEIYNDLDSSHWSYTNVEELSKMGIISGYPDGSFKPDKKVTYAEFIKMVYTATVGGEPEKVYSGHWALNYYYDSIKAGILSAGDVYVNELDNEIPRNMMALMIFNSVKGLSKSGLKSSDEILKRISDVKKDDDLSREIAVSYELGVLNGYPDGSFKPDNVLSRSEAATSIFRLIEKLKEENTGYDSDNKEVKKDSFKVENGDFYLDSYDVSLGFKGVDKFVYSGESGCIGVYSKTIQDIALYVDKKLAPMVVNTEGNYWKEEGYFVYVFNVKDLLNSNSRLGVCFELDMKDVYYYADAAI